MTKLSRTERRALSVFLIALSDIKKCSDLSLNAYYRGKLQASHSILVFNHELYLRLLNLEISALQNDKVLP